jgi:hypothetical protein
VARWKKVLLSIAGGFLLLSIAVASQVVCLPAWIGYGVVIPECADGEMRVGVTVDAGALRRGEWGAVVVGAVARYTTGPADEVRAAPIDRLEPSVFLLNGSREVPLPPEKGWEDAGSGRRVGRVMLPADLEDGEYRLLAKVDTSLGAGRIDVPLPVFAPAVVHVLTDRPLYEPGNTMKFRAVVLRARNLAPLEGRPGKWIVTDPMGEVVLEDRAPAGEYGVVAGDFPLDQGAAAGDWRIRWESGAARDEVTVRVEPFTLPRFSVEASSVKPFYTSGERPRIRGRVTYSSGAPVASAILEMEWSSSGEWPPPTSWMQGDLPRRASTDPSGEVELVLPEVPGDLRGRATLYARVAAVDPAGDRVEGSASVLLSKDAITVESVTELYGGLVEGFNNRVFLRASTAGGAVLARSKLRVKRTWDPTDKGTDTETDEDGVAVLQLDPGPAVNIVIPPMPARAPPRPPAIERTHAQALISGEAPSLKDQVALDTLARPLEPCARFVNGSDNVTVSVWIDPSGAIRATAPDTPLGRCFADVLEKQRFPVGADRILTLGYGVTSDLPTISFEAAATIGEAPERVEQAIGEALLDARTCLPDDVEATHFPRVLAYRYANDAVSVKLVRDDDGGALPERFAACVEARLQRLVLPKKGEEEGDTPEHFGFARLYAHPAPRYQAARPQATVMLGYEMSVAAETLDGEAIGKTEIRFEPGSVPDVRLRPSKVLASRGETVKVELIRGPSFTGDLPEKLYLRHEQKTLEADFDEESRSASFALPKELEGWFEATFSGARALIYVRPESELELAVTPDRERYEPRDRARLAISTKAGGKGTPAAVGLFGVDQSLSQIAALTGPDAMARIRPKVEMREKAFGALDAEALALGRIRGRNAAEATVLLVSSIPAPAEYDSYVGTSGATVFDPLETLTDHFYVVLGALHDEVRAWERSAPKGELMKPPRMASMWQKALASCRQKKEPISDAYGRDLELHQLPDDLLELVAPRSVVIEGTRLPEDVENWNQWVRRNLP